MAQYDIGQLINKYGVGNNWLGNPDQQYNVAAPPKPEKQNFFGNVAKSAVKLTGQALGTVANDAVSGFTGLYGNIKTNLGYDKKVGGFESVNKTLDKRLLDVTTAYRNKQLSKADYTKALKEIQAGGEANSSDLKTIADQYAGYGDVAINAAKAGATALTVAAPALEVGAAAKAIPVVGRLLKGAEEGLGVGKSIGSNIVTATAGKLARNSLVAQPTINQPGQIIDAARKGDTASLATNAALLAAPAIIGAGAKLLPAAAGKLKTAMQGVRSFVDEIPTKDGIKIGEYARNLKAGDPLQEVAKVFQKYNLDQAGGRVDDAVQRYTDWLGRGVKSENLTAKEHLEFFKGFMNDVDKIRSAARSGELAHPGGGKWTESEINKLWPGRFDQTDRKALVDQLIQAGNAAERQGLATRLATQEQWGLNPNLRDQIIQLAGQDDFGKQINKVFAGRALGGLDLNAGRVPILRESVKTQIPSAANAGELIQGKKAAPILGSINRGLTKAGLGIEDYNPKSFGIAKENFVKSIDEKLGGGGKDTFTQLTDLADSLKLSDVRQLKVNEIARNLNIGTAQARLLSKTLDDAYSSVPLSLRGAGDRIQDINLKYNPLAKPYARLQSKLRYTENPAFKVQQIIEPTIIGQGFAGGKAPKAEIDTVVQTMRKEGFIPAFGKGFSGEATEGALGLPKVTGHLTNLEERGLANQLILTAKKNGQSVEQMLKDEPTRQLLRSLVQYPSKGLASSNLAKAVNLAVFPLRYNAKVTALAVKALAKQPAAAQFAITKGLLDFKKFVNSEEGIKWKSDNSELLGIIEYFTPINSIESILHMLPGQGGSFRDLGVIGGLPFGVIQRVLQGQGIVPSGQPPYLDPKTGELIPDKIPDSSSGKLKQFLRDVIDTAFTFPGRRAGLGSKQSLIDAFTGNQLKLNKGEFTAKDTSGDLSAQQKRQQEVLQRYRGVSQPSIPSKTLQPGTVPQVSAPKITPIFKAGSGPKPVKPKTKAKRIGQPF